MTMLASYAWPGNIRELSNLVERLAILKPEGTIDVDDLPPKYRKSTPRPGTATNNVGTDITYTPNTDFVGADTFTYTIDDGTGRTATVDFMLRFNPIVEALQAWSKSGCFGRLPANPAGAAWTKQSDEFTLFDEETHIINDKAFSVALENS